jgi:hypothetical protein
MVLPLRGDATVIDETPPSAAATATDADVVDDAAGKASTNDADIAPAGPLRFATWATPATLARTSGRETGRGTGGTSGEI